MTRGRARQRVSTLAVVLLAVAVVVEAAACGGDDDEESAPTTPTRAHQPAPIARP